MSTYRPLPYYLTIAKSDMLSAITGKDELGLFATENIPSNTNMGITHVFDNRFEDGLIRTPLGGFFNHNSKDPNCRVVHGVEYIYLESLRDIEKGEEITAKYTLYDPEKK